MNTKVSQSENGYSVGEIAMVTTPEGVIPATILAFDLYNKCPIAQPEVRMPMYVLWENIRKLTYEDFVNRQPNPHAQPVQMSQPQPQTPQPTQQTDDQKPEVPYQTPSSPADSVPEPKLPVAQ